jgi:hypothetical protein
MGLKFWLVGGFKGHTLVTNVGLGQTTLFWPFFGCFQGMMSLPGDKVLIVNENFML